MPEETQGDLTSTEAWTVIHCSNKKGWDLLNKGELEGYYVGRTIRITRKSIDAYKLRHRYVQRKDLAGRGAVMSSRGREPARSKSLRAAAYDSVDAQKRQGDG